jgi:hypothetical protein
MSLSSQESDDEPDPDVEELRARVDLLREENRRLRRQYAATRRSQYRRTAALLFLAGAVALVAASLFPDARTVLVAVGSVGVFAAVLTVYLTPERFVPASVGERVSAAAAANGDALVADLGLADDRLYVPTDGAVRLFVPQHADYDLPDAAALDPGFVVTDADQERGVALVPSGGQLFEAFERTHGGPLADEPGPLANQLVDALVEQFELVDGARPDVDSDDGRVTLGISGSAYGDVTRFDHPVTSFLAVGVATGLDAPVSASVAEGDDRSDYLVTLRWAPSDATGD